MKYILFLSILSTLTYAQPDSVQVHKIRSIELDKKEATITFWSTNVVMRLPVNSKHLPCLDNAFKAEKEVVLGMIKNTNTLVDCKLYGGGIPRLR